MPIVSDKTIISPVGVLQQNPAADIPKELPTILNPTTEVKSVAIDTKWVPRNALLTHIEGANWIVNYYSQVLTTDSNLSGQQLSASPVYQQYKLIKSLELKVITPLSTSQDDVTKSMTVNGSSQLYPFLIPNEGDMFSADIGEGRIGVFRITTTIKKSIFQEACYEINYVLDTDWTDKLNDLDDKVVETLYFHKDNFKRNQNPLILKEEVDTIVDMDLQYYQLSRYYFKKFFSKEFQTLIVPNQEYSTYDHYLIKFILAAFTQEDANEILYIRKLNVDDSIHLKCDSILDAILNRDMIYTNTCFKRAGVVSTRIFNSDPLLQGIIYTGINKTIYPIDPILSVDNETIDNAINIDTNNLNPSSNVSTINNIMVKSLNLRNVDLNINEVIKLITIDDYYIFSQSFYDETNQQSLMETLVWNYIKKQQIDKDQILDTSKLCVKWSLLEQFYYIPILLFMMKSIVRGL